MAILFLINTLAI